MELDSEPKEIDLSDRFRETSRDGEKVWMTDLPPPAGFTGYENCDYGDPDEIYERECTLEEAEILEADAARARNAERAEEEELRDTWLALLKADIDASRHAELTDPTVRHAELVSASIPEKDGTGGEMDPDLRQDADKREPREDHQVTAAPTAASPPPPSPAGASDP